MSRERVPIFAVWFLDNFSAAAHADGGTGRQAKMPA
jgi:hypothetical protein